jgi:F-type H+-transporting ATPase subunit a
VNLVLGLEFPPLTHLVDWPGLVGDGKWWEINKVVIIMAAAAALTILFFVLANKKQEVPTGTQNLAEMAVEFVEDGIVMQTMGPDGLAWTPYLLSLFFFILFTNIFEVVPLIQMPASARIALPMFLALLTWVLFNAAGVKHQGLGGYLKSSLFPPGVPIALYLLVTPIEFVSVFLVRPFSLMVRLFANLLAGHILLTTFAILSAGLFTAKWYAVFYPLPLLAVVAFTLFEVLVSVLQAYVFTLLAGVYIGGAMHPDH